MRTYLPVFLCIIGINFTPLNAQTNFLGKPGLITIPSAEWEDKRPLGVSFSYVPREYTGSMFFPNGIEELNTLNLYNIRAGLASFMDVNLSIAYRTLSERTGIGDRHLDFRFRLLKETKYLPALVMGITPPGSVSPILSHDYLVGNKNINSSIGTFRITVGYGSPYLVVRRKNDDHNFFQEFSIEEKANHGHGNQYLTGFFGGLTYLPVDFGGVMLEYNTSSFNAGVFVTIWDWLQLQAQTYEGKKAAFSIAGNFKLNHKPKALRQYEKSLD